MGCDEKELTAAAGNGAAAKPKTGTVPAHGEDFERERTAELPAAHRDGRPNPGFN